MTIRLIALLAIAAATASAVPTVMNHQGRIAIAGTNYDGTGHFKFALVDAAGTTTFWSNDATPSGEPAAAVPVTVTKGHYAHLLGESNPLPPATFAAEDDIRLRVWFSTDNTTFTQLTPDRRLTPAAYAFTAGTAATLAPSYETGSGSDLLLGSIGGSGGLTLDASYTQSFASAPGVALPDGWTVTANDEDGFTAEADFVPQTVDASGVTGSHTSLAVIAGRPAIAYRSDSEGDLLFIRAADCSGTTWPTADIVRVAGAGIADVGEYASLAAVSGRPAIAYYDATAGDLKYVRANDAEGTSWPTALTIDGATSNTGRHCSLAVIAGKPAISYTSPNTGELVYAEALDAEGTAWQTVAVEGAIADYRRFTSLAAVAGEPAIATHDHSTDSLRYVYRSAGSWNAIIIDPAGGQDPDLALIDGRPAIAYRTAGGALKLAHASDAAGTAWPTPVTLAASGREPSLADIAGQAAISYYNPSTGDLELHWGGATRSIDGALSNVGTHSSLALIAGLPAIAYRDESTSDLKFAALPDAAWSATLGDPAPILASGVKSGAVTEAMLSEEVASSLAAKDEEIADLKARVEALERAVFGASAP